MTRRWLQTVLALVLTATLAAACGSGGTGGGESGAAGGNAVKETPGAGGAANEEPVSDGGATDGPADPDTPVSSDGTVGGGVTGGGAASGDSGGGTNGSVGEVGHATAEEASKAVLDALKADDLEALKKLIHPDKGVLFSPYAYIDTETAVTFKAGELPSLGQENALTWGSYDGSGEPITLSFGEYYDKFVYDKDFAAADEVGKNEIIGQGNTLVNIKDVFPEAAFFDHHVKGTDASAEGMDWASLILVLEQKDANWYVSAIVHNQWTI